ncbi:MAG TPA: hypothetical protein VIK28_00305 [Sedimentisphaerales bacterium]
MRRTVHKFFSGMANQLIRCYPEPTWGLSNAAFFLLGIITSLIPSLLIVVWLAWTDNVFAERD